MQETPQVVKGFTIPSQDHQSKWNVPQALVYSHCIELHMHGAKDSANHKNESCSRPQRDWIAKITQKEGKRNSTRDLTRRHRTVIYAAWGYHKKAGQKSCGEFIRRGMQNGKNIVREASKEHNRGRSPVAKTQELQLWVKCPHAT